MNTQIKNAKNVLVVVAAMSAAVGIRAFQFSTSLFVTNLFVPEKHHRSKRERS